jgi:alkylation response protein AidB-like acyl-CoA dehydrogenase
MDMSFTPAQLAFREEARAWIATAMTPRIRAKAEVDGHFEHEETMEWHRILYRKGWVAPHWPVEHGGPGLDLPSRFILADELERAGAPRLNPFGLAMVGPLLMQFGTESQKARFLPKIRAGDEVWCQGYSEPNAGSDLASLRLRADPDGRGHFVVNGQKTWTTHAQYADWMFCLARTDLGAKKQEGISFLLVDMRTPGITVKPCLTTAGTFAFCETFFEGVRVPEANLVGALHGGWTVAKALLGHERTFITAVGQSARTLSRIKRIAAQSSDDGKNPLEAAGFAAKIARLEIKLRSLEMANYRALAGAQLGRAPGPEASILKIRGSEILQQCFELAMEVMGHNSLSWFNEQGVIPAVEQTVAQEFNYTRATTIYGGSSEIQKNVIAKQILGLPSR